MMDRVDPGVGLVRLRSPNGLGVNVFVLEADDGVALVDTGFGFTGAALADGLTAGGYALGDVESVLLTHLHEDHVGGAIALQSRWGATVYAGDRSADVLDDWVAWYEPRVAFADWMPRQLGPSAVLDAQIAARERRVPTPLVEGPHRGLAHWQPVQVGAEVRVGAYRFVCVDARGHDPRHVAWYEPDRRWLFAGDVVLGVPTPITPLMDDDMGDYRRTLLRWSRQLDVAWLLPGHGRPSERFDRSVVLSLGFLRSIHSRVAAALAEGPVRLADLAAAASTRTDGTLDARRAFIATVNPLAALLELETMGVVRRLDGPGMFEAVRPVPAFDAMP